MNDDKTAAENLPAAEWVKPSDLKPWSDNPRLNDDAIEPVAESIKRFGFAAPIVALRSTREVIAGHTRLKAAISLGLEKIPVRFVDLTDAEAHALAVADNKLGELAPWDFGKLSSVIAQLQKDSADVVPLLGFSQEELNKLSTVESGSFLDAFDTAATADASTEAIVTTPNGEYITFAVRLTPDQDRLVQEALRAAKSKWRVRTNLDALIAMCQSVKE